MHDKETCQLVSRSSASKTSFPFHWFPLDFYALTLYSLTFYREGARDIVSSIPIWSDLLKTHGSPIEKQAAEAYN